MTWRSSALRSPRPRAHVACHPLDRAARQVALVDGVEIALRLQAARGVGPAQALEDGLAVGGDVDVRGHRPRAVAEGVDEQRVVAAGVQLDAVESPLADHQHHVEQGVHARPAEDHELAGPAVIDQGQPGIAGAPQGMDGLEVAALLVRAGDVEVVRRHLTVEPMHGGGEVAEDLVPDAVDGRGFLVTGHARLLLLR